VVGSVVMALKRQSGPIEIGVLGAGYVGLVTAACLADRGHTVSVIEVDRGRLAALSRGEAPFHEPGLQALLDRTLRAGLIRPSGDPTVLATADAVLVCVGTPLDPEGEADLSQVRSACATIARYTPGAAVIVRSTLPIGTTEQLQRWLRRSDLRRVVTNPEFLRQGSAIADFKAPTRIVIGTHDGFPSAVSDLVEQLHGAHDAPVIITDYPTAEMIKNAANAFLATKLSFVNEVADLCEAYGADVAAVAEGIGLDPRIGQSYLQPGIGFGGSCLPKELANLMRLGESRGLPMRLLNAASAANGGRISRICDRLERLSGGLRDLRIAQLGLSFKPNTDDLRHSPALDLAKAMIERGANVVAHDPQVPLARTADISGLERATTVAGALRDADLVILATEWPEYIGANWLNLRRIVRRAWLFDGRNALNERSVRAAGWRVARIGRTADRFDAGGNEPASALQSRPATIRRAVGATR
jgi:UDPglucose 6-dehydrogenase